MHDHKDSPALQQTAEQADPRLRRAPYTTPELIEYGSVAKLTQNGFGSGGDGGVIANMMMICL